MSFNDIDAIVLAGGLGTRLREVHPDTQKVVAPVGGRPFLQRIIDLLNRAGCRRIVFATGHKAEQVETVIDAGQPAAVEMVLSREDRPLGTAGAVRLALSKTTSSLVLVLNGDSFVQADLASFLAFHREKGGLASLLLTRVEAMSRYGAVETDPDGRVLAFTEKDGSKTGPGYINAGIYLIERHVLEAIPSDQVMSLEKDVFPHYCGDRLFAMKQNAPFIDIGTPESYLSAENFFENLDADADVD